MPMGFKNYSEGHNWAPIEAINNMVGATLLVLNIQVELLQVCGPFMIAIIL
jgi:hypothetical protein